MSFAPGSLSTLDYASDIFAGPYGGLPKPFNLSNFPCPPQSLLDAQESANQVGFSLPARPGYAPIIAPPPALQNLEPAWKYCQSQFAFDPPRSLVPASALVPSPTPTNQGAPQLTPAMPSPPIEDPPAQTQPANSPIVVKPSSSGDHPPDLPNTVEPLNNQGPTSSSKQGNTPESETPERPDTVDPSDGEESNANNKQGNIPELETPERPDTVHPPNAEESNANSIQDDIPESEIPGQPNTVDPPANNKQGNTLESDLPVADQPPQPQAEQDGLEDPKAPKFPDTGTDRIFQPFPVQGTPVSLDKSEIVLGSSTLLLPTADRNGVLIAAGQTFTPYSPGSILVNGNTLSVDGPPTTVSGTRLSLASFGFVVGTQTFAFPTPAPDRMSGVNRIVTFEGQPVTQLGNGAVAFHGLTLVPNGPAVTISNTVISLAPSDLVIGSQTFPLPTPAPSALPGAVVIDQTTLFAGGPAATISGNTLSLASGRSGFFISGHRSDAPAFSAPMTAGESASIDTEGRLVVDGSHDIEPLASAIMRGFGPTNQALTASAAGYGVGRRPGDPSNATTGVLGFTGGGGGRRSRFSELRIAAVAGLAICLGLFIS